MSKYKDDLQTLPISRVYHLLTREIIILKILYVVEFLKHNDISDTYGGQ